MSENRASRHGFGVKEFVLYFDGVIGDFTRLPCFSIFDETTRLRGPLVSTSTPEVRVVRLALGLRMEQGQQQGNREGLDRQGRDRAELAAKLGMKPEDLEATITRYNENCKTGRGSRFRPPEADPGRDR